MERPRSPLPFRPFAAMGPRQLINFSIMGLTLFVVGLSGVMTWQAYRDYRANQQMVLADTIADHLIRAAGATATERGLTSAALGIGRQVPPGIRSRIAELRHQGDAAWQAALASAEALKAAGTNHAFSATIDAAIQARRDLQDARERVDRCLAGPAACTIGGPEWIGAGSAFIEAAERTAGWDLPGDRAAAPGGIVKSHHEALGLRGERKRGPRARHPCVVYRRASAAVRAGTGRPESLSWRG